MVNFFPPMLDGERKICLTSAYKTALIQMLNAMEVPLLGHSY